MSDQPMEVPDDLMPGQMTDLELGLSEIEAKKAGCGTEKDDNSDQHDFDYDDDGE